MVSPGAHDPSTRRWWAVFAAGARRSVFHTPAQTVALSSLSAELIDGSDVQVVCELQAPVVDVDEFDEDAGPSSTCLPRRDIS